LPVVVAITYRHLAERVVVDNAGVVVGILILFAIHIHG